jgi:hypothetical protein
MRYLKVDFGIKGSLSDAIAKSVIDKSEIRNASEFVNS